MKKQYAIHWASGKPEDIEQWMNVRASEGYRLCEVTVSAPSFIIMERDVVDQSRIPYGGRA